MSKIVGLKYTNLFILLGVGVASYLGYKWYQNKNAAPVKTNPNESRGDENNAPEQSAPPNPNHLAEKVEVKISDGSTLKGFPYPQDLSKLKFPITVISLNDKLGIAQASGFQVKPSGLPDKPFTFKGDKKVDKFVTKQELIENTLLM